MTLRVVVVVAWLCASCGHTTGPCAISDFAPAPFDHIIENLGSLHARGFRGVLLSKDIPGDLPEIGARFEVRGARGFVTTVPVLAGGRFSRDLPPGEYCFKLSAPGFRSGTGRIQIDPAAVAYQVMIPLTISE